ncbi:hypothetical protein [Streptomyces caatingaensis]|uniref:Dynamin family protein n=1 Tax=Streptomyces caatingaensis TaxID=1678637 RepID=A0A0K9XKE3_9ACTN|nr:hypothetical protein [Streptomyces caatingaensis]KNB53844.1 hypothetical protein AC230_04440 [Streptomyces caatingaensis]
MPDSGQDPALPLEACLAEAEALARDHGLHGVLAELAGMTGQLHRPACRIVVAGEAMSGAPELTGRLAGPGAEASVVQEGTGKFPAPRLLLRSSPLGEDVELVEAPALNQAAEADELACRLAHHADALVMTTRAVAPFGRTETDFADRALGRGRLRRVALVLTGEDRLPEDRRAPVREHVRARAERLGPGIAVLGDRDGLDALRALVRSWTGAEDRQASRRRQIAAQLADLCARMAATGRRDEAAARRAAEERAGRDAAGADAERAGLRMHVDRRRTEAVTELRGRLERERTGLLEELRRSLAESPDAGHWWDTSLSYELHRGLLDVAGRQAEWFGHRLETEARWLAERLSALEGAPVAAQDTAAPDALLELDEPVRQRLHLQDLGGRKLLYQRLGPVGAGLLAAVALPGPALPVALIGGAAALAAGETRFQRLAEHQRQAVGEALTRIVRQAVEEFADAAARHLRSAYRDLAENALAPPRHEPGAPAPEGLSLSAAAARLRARLPAGTEPTPRDHG